MQRTLLLLTLLAAPVAASTASSAAVAWLSSHKSPTDDQLKELAGSNPAAFAIVNALLAKHAKGGPMLAPEERGPDVFKRMMANDHPVSAYSASRPSVAVPYASAELAEVSAPVVDQASYNPKSASDRDESSVSKLLRAVASMGGRKGAKLTALINKRHVAHHEAAESSLASDASLFEDQPQVEQVQNIELPAMEQPKAAAPQKKENSYLKGIDLSGDMPAVEASPKHFAANLFESTNNLATFSFDDAAPAAPKPVPVVAPKPKKNNAFMDFLYGGPHKAPAPEEQAQAAPVQKKTNSYLDSVKFFG